MRVRAVAPTVVPMAEQAHGAKESAMSHAANAPSLSFSHVGIYVRDIALMEDFYRRVMGFIVTDRGSLPPVELVFLSRDPAEHHQLVLASGRPEEVPFNVINQLSFRVADIAALRRFHDIVQGEAVSDLRPITHGNAISLYFRDPEGNRIEVFFDTPWYCLQPVRKPLDFSQTDTQIMARAEAVARSLPDFKPRAQWIAEMKARMQAGIHA